MKTVTLECKQKFYGNGQIYLESYYLDGKLHNPNGVARKFWYENGQIESEGYFIDGKRHNPNGIAYKNWYKDGQIWSESYYLDGKDLTKEEFDNIKSKPCNNKTVEVDGVKYKLKAI